MFIRTISMRVKLGTKASFILMIGILVRLLCWLNQYVRWVNNISQGKEDTRQTVIKAEFIEGGTIGAKVLKSGSLAFFKKKGSRQRFGASLTSCPLHHLFLSTLFVGVRI